MEGYIKGVSEWHPGRQGGTQAGVLLKVRFGGWETETNGGGQFRMKKGRGKGKGGIDTCSEKEE